MQNALDKKDTAGNSNPDMDEWMRLNAKYEKANKDWYKQDELVKATQAKLTTETANKQARDKAASDAATKATRDADAKTRKDNLTAAKKDVTDEKEKKRLNDLAITNAKAAKEANKGDTAS